MGRLVLDLPQHFDELMDPIGNRLSRVRACHMLLNLVDRLGTFCLAPSSSTDLN